MAERTKLNHEGLLALEQPFLKVPFEQFKKAFRNSQKYVEKGVVELNGQLSDLSQKFASGGNAVSVEETTKTVDNMLNRLQNLKRKLEESKSEEHLYTQRTKARLDHLVELTNIPTADSENYARWSKTRLDRMLVDYMLRNGYSGSAERVAKETHIESLVDIELFAQARRVEEALLRRSCTECLQWCNENRSNLRKMKSTLEFNLRLQEYIELIRERKISEAIQYSRKHLTPWSETHMKEIQQAMALVAFTPKTSCYKYRYMFDDSRWQILIHQFRADNYELHSLTNQPLIKMTLQAGLAALKTPMCSQPTNKNINCPVCDDTTFGALSKGLPNALHRNSCIVCRISGVILNEDNPPYVLPNGNVYGLRSLEEMSAQQKGMVTCPRSGAVFPFAACRKVHIMT